MWTTLRRRSRRQITLVGRTRLSAIDDFRLLSRGRFVRNIVLNANRWSRKRVYCAYFGGVVRDFRVLRYEPDTETRLVHVRWTRRMQEPGTPEQYGTLAAVRRHFGHGQIVGHQTVRRSVYPAAASFAVAITDRENDRR